MAEINFGKVIKKEIKETPRIGVSYAKEDAQFPWRYILKNY